MPRWRFMTWLILAFNLLMAAWALGDVILGVPQTQQQQPL